MTILHEFCGQTGPTGRFRLVVDGPLTSKTLGAVLAIVDLQRQWLIQDEAASVPTPMPAHQYPEINEFPGS